MSAAIWPTGTTNAFSTTLSSSIDDNDTTIALTTATGLNTGGGVVVIDRQDANGTDTPSTREYVSFTGVSGNSLTGCSRGLGGSTAQAHSSGANVEEVWSITHWNDFLDAFQAEHGSDGTHSDVTSAVSAASTSVAGKVELATAAETTTGTDAARAVSPDGLAGSNYGKRHIGILVFSDATEVSAGDGAGDVFIRIPSTMNGWNLVGVAASNQTAATGSGSETTDIQIHNVTQAADMLTTKLTIDEDEIDSSTAATAAVIDTSNDDVATGDQLRIDVDAVPSTTGGNGLFVELTFQLP